MRYLIAVLLLLPTMAVSHERVINGIVVPNGYAPAWENGRVNRSIGVTDEACFVEAGSFETMAEAEAARAAMAGGNAQVVVSQGAGQLSLLIGPYPNRDAAQAGLNAAYAAGLGHGQIR